MDAKITLKLNKKEIQASLEEWEKLRLKLNSLLGHKEVFVPFIQRIPEPVLPPYITYTSPTCAKGKWV